MNRFFCAVDRFQPCRVILVCVSEKADAVAVNKRRAGCAREGLGCQNARRGCCFAGGSFSFALAMRVCYSSCVAGRYDGVWRSLMRLVTSRCVNRSPLRQT